MAASLLLAPAAAGKTTHALARLRAVRAESALAPVAVVLPNTLQLAAFRRRLAAAGGAFGVPLYTFYGLYAELLARAGQPLPVLDNAGQIRILRGLVEALARRGELAYFAPLRGKAGLAAVLREACEELERAGIQPEDCAAAAHALGPRLREMARLYAAYQHWLQEHAWADPEGAGWLAARALEQDPALAGDLRLLVVDGFDEFNPTQLAVLGQLAARAGETLITLTGQPGPPRLAHRRFQRARQKLVEALHPQIVWTADADKSTVAAPLRHLEAHLFGPPVTDSYSPALNGQPAIAFLSAQTRALEARAALRWIKARIVLDGLPAGETAVLARSLDPYRRFLEEVAREFGMPLRVVGGAPLAECPPVSALLNLLALPAEGTWRPRRLLAAVRSPYFDWAALGIDASTAAVLDLVSRLGRVVEGLEQWREALASCARPRREPWQDEPEAGAPHVSPEAAQAARAAFEALVARLTPPPAPTLRAHIAFVEALIGDEEQAAGSLNMPACARAEPQTAARDLAALGAAGDALRGLLASAPATLDYPAFLHAWRESVYSAVVDPQPADGVVAAAALDVRGLSFGAVAVLGLAEGEFPQPEREMPLLREVDRAALREVGLPLEPRLRGEEPSAFYHAVTRARARLLLCRPCVADNGQPWEPSAYWREAARLCGDSRPMVVRAEDRLPPEQVASAVEWIDHGYEPAALAAGVAVLRARLAASAAGPHEGDLSTLAPALAGRFAADRSWSASRLETYGTCGFYFLVAHVLDLEPRAEPEAGYDVRALGSIYHSILERLYRDAPAAVPLAERLQRLPQVAAEVFAAAPHAHGFRPTALWQQQQAELLGILETTVRALDAQSAGWTPRLLEQRFGFGSPPLVVRTDAGEVRLHGYIDRVDVDATGRLRVVDYKAGGSPIRPADLAAGRRLQLPLYALAAREALGLGEVAAGLYWHIGRAEASDLRLEGFAGGVPGALETAVRHLAAHVAHIRAGRFLPRPPEGGCPTYCPATAFCWRRVSKGA
ncbi:MAG: PD-(D/E)XK nuclease family protein [Candidatus Latescibacterota bacterium]